MNITEKKHAIEFDNLLCVPSSSKEGERMPLRNTFTGKQATPDEQQDMLKIRTIRQTDLDAMIEHTYLAKSSTIWKYLRNKQK